MTIARSKKINLSATPYYHVVSRCVRRTFLCGQDKETGKDYSHRKQWLVDRIKFLSHIFSIRIAAYAIMSNHYHIVLHVDQNKAERWTNNEVIKRASQLFPSKAKELELTMKLTPESPIVAETIEEWRSRLFDISWFMKSINQPIARFSNIEDDCKGHFWESRFKSQALLDEGAVLRAMVYVDLNPIRAGISKTPEESDFTSIQERLKSYPNHIKKSTPQPLELMHFESEGSHNKNNPLIHFNLEDYFCLVDETGRMLAPNKPGIINPIIAPILDRLDVKTDGWLTSVKNLDSLYAYVIGREDLMKNFGEFKRGPKGIRTARKQYLYKVA